MLYQPGTTGLRVLHALALHIGEPRTVQQLTADIQRLYGKSYYANAYRELQQLKKPGLITWGKAGRNASIHLNLEHARLPDYLLLLETWKRLQLLEEHPQATFTLDPLTREFAQYENVQSAWLLEARRSLRLNRFPLLILTGGQTGPLQRNLNAIAAKHEVRLDTLTMTPERFHKIRAQSHDHPLRAWFDGAINLLGAHRFWLHATQAQPDVSRAAAQADRNAEMLATLARLGYEEFGAPATQAPSLPLEVLVVQLLESDDARRRRAALPVLERNKFDAPILAFMARRKGQAERLRALLAQSKANTDAIRDLRNRLEHGVE